MSHFRSMARFAAEYQAALHAVQSGVAQEMAMDARPEDQDRKHLRVGNVARACDHAALVRLLVAKGLFTEEEYGSEILLELQREVKRFEDRLTERLGAKVTLA